MELTQRIENLLTPPAQELGLNIVRIRFGGEGKNRTLQILVERLDETPVSVEECGKFSREASALLDVEDLIDGAYSLEASSAGMERPLMKLSDYKRFEGRAARIETHDLIDGQKRFKGILKGIEEDDTVIIECEDNGENAALPFSTIYRGKLIVTDEMIKQAQRKAKDAQKTQKN